MESLLLEIKRRSDENEVIGKNITLLSEKYSISVEILNEAVTTWLAKVRNATAAGKLDPAKKDSVASILGALSAISNPDLADALDERGDLGTVLFNVSSDDRGRSNAALQRLLLIGREPSIKTFVGNALKAMDDPQAIDRMTKQIQTKIEPIMNKKLAAERKASGHV